MKSQRLNRISKTMLSGLVLIALLAFSSSSVFAAVSADATIFNQVTVSYASGTQTLTATADVSVTVITLAAIPTISVDKTTDTAIAGGVVVYTYTARSNANGEDTYDLTTIDSVDANVSASTDSSVGTPFTLWGGIVLSSGADTIGLPGGSVANVATNETVELLVNGSMQRYTVTAISGGTAEIAGTPEVPALLTLTPIGTSEAITSTNVNAGTQVGEYSIFYVNLTVGDITTPGTDGTHTTNLTFTTNATDAGGTVVTYTTSAGDTNETVTTVISPEITITKESSNITTGSGFVSNNSTTAKPGEIIGYKITVTNTHATAAVSSVTVSDAVPAYTTLVKIGSDFATVDDGSASGPVNITLVNTDTEDSTIGSGDAGINAGDSINFYIGTSNHGDHSAGTVTGGSVAAGAIYIIEYAVTVN